MKWSVARVYRQVIALITDIMAEPRGRGLKCLHGTDTDGYTKNLKGWKPPREQRQSAGVVPKAVMCGRFTRFSLVVASRIRRYLEAPACAEKAQAQPRHACQDSPAPQFGAGGRSSRGDASASGVGTQVSAQPG